MVWQIQLTSVSEWTLFSAHCSPRAVETSKSFVPKLNQQGKYVNITFLFHGLIRRLEQQYRYIYFNQVNLAVKSSLFSKRSPHNTITSDIMKLISEISSEYQRYHIILCLVQHQVLNYPCAYVQRVLCWVCHSQIFSDV